MAVGVKLYVRYENLKHVVLDELLSEHDHAELDAQLDEAAWWSALWGNKRQRCTFTVHLHTHTHTNINQQCALLDLPPPCDSLQRHKHNPQAAQQTCM